MKKNVPQKKVIEKRANWECEENDTEITKCFALKYKLCLKAHNYIQRL